MNTETPIDGYSRLSILVHWLTALSVIALFVTHEADRGSSAYFVHVSIGGGLGLFLLWRVWYRARRGFAVEPEQHAALNLLSRLVLWGFLVSIVVVILTGYLLPWSRGAALDMLGLFSIPSPIAGSRDFHEFIEEVHDISGHLFMPLLLLHVAGALKHHFIDRDGVLMRMVKGQNGGR